MFENSQIERVKFQNFKDFKSIFDWKDGRSSEGLCVTVCYRSTVSASHSRERIFI